MQYYHKYSWGDFLSLAPNFAWPSYFMAAFNRTTDLGFTNVIVYTPSYLQGLNALLQTTPKDIMQVYSPIESSMDVMPSTDPSIIFLLRLVISFIVCPSQLPPFQNVEISYKQSFLFLSFSSSYLFSTTYWFKLFTLTCHRCPGLTLIFIHPFVMLSQALHPYHPAGACVWDRSMHLWVSCWDENSWRLSSLLRVRRRLRPWLRRSGWHSSKHFQR